MESTPPVKAEGEDMVCPTKRLVAGVLHTGWGVANPLDKRYDGDTCSLMCFMSDDALEEMNTELNSRDFYVAVDGTFAFSAANDVINLVLGNLA